MRLTPGGRERVSARLCGSSPLAAGLNFVPTKPSGIRTAVTRPPWCDDDRAQTIRSIP